MKFMRALSNIQKWKSVTQIYASPQTNRINCTHLQAFAYKNFSTAAPCGSPVRVVIVGQSTFASEVYKKVKQNGHQVVGVFTIPDKGNREETLGYGKELKIFLQNVSIYLDGTDKHLIILWQEDAILMRNIKKWATLGQQDGILVHKVKKWRDGDKCNPELYTLYKELQPDITLLAFCLQFIPMEISKLSKLGTVCYHPSLLPRHRGMSAVNWTLIYGDKEAGFSLFSPDEGLDTGNLYYKESTPVDPNDTVDTLYNRFMYPKGIEAMANIIDRIVKDPSTTPQTEEGATYNRPLRTLEQCTIRFEELSAQQMHNFIRGMDKVPGACVEIDNKLARVYGSRIWTGDIPSGQPVEVKGMKKPGIVHSGGLILYGNDGGTINIKTLKFEESGRLINASTYGQDESKDSSQSIELKSDEKKQYEEIKVIWKNILSMDINDATDFFKSGAGSMDVTRLVEELKEKCKITVENEDIYMNPVFKDFVNTVFMKQRSCSSSPKLEFNAVTLHVNNMDIKFPTQLFINNTFVNSSNGATLKSVNPSDESIICEVQCASKEDVDTAVRSASAAFYNGEWGKMNARDRARLMFRLADFMEEHKEELATLESIDSGAVYTLALKTHVGMSIDTWRYFAGWCDKIQGATIPINNARPNRNLTFTRKEPIGVCGIVTPWNYPLMMVSWKAAACLAAGNTVVLKPAQVSPLTALKLAELSVYAGFPPGVINVLPGRGSECGQAIAEHPEIRKLGFTGSTPIGKQIMKSCAMSNLKKVSLELGGKSPLIIFSDCDLDKAVRMAMSGVFFNKGENCIAAGRIFVEKKIHEEFVKRVVEETSKMVIGDPLDRSTDHGPQNHKSHLDKLLEYIDIGVKEGAKLVYGGKRVDRPGLFLEPTIFTNVTDDMFIAKEESFGPIMVVSEFEDGGIDEVLRRANATEFGLASGVFTRDIQKALFVTERIQAGTCFVNCYNKTDVAAPFGGFKQSGFGKDLGYHKICCLATGLLGVCVYSPGNRDKKKGPTGKNNGEEALNEYLKTKCVTIEY